VQSAAAVTPYTYNEWVEELRLRKKERRKDVKI
jgi:hypothetical protein